MGSCALHDRLEPAEPHPDQFPNTGLSIRPFVDHREPLRLVRAQRQNDPSSGFDAADTFDRWIVKPAEQAEVPDPFAPRVLNTAKKFDNHKVSAAWTTYGDNDEDAADDGPVELVPDWIEKWAHNINEGSGGLGKSYIKAQDAICLSAGHPIYGKSTEKVSSWYFNYEEPEDEFRRRVSRIRRALGDGEPIPLGDFKVRHLRNEPAAHILRVTSAGSFLLTRFGAEFLDALTKQRGHTYVTFDGLMDAILFEGSTRMEDAIVRQLLAEIDRWCREYDCTIASILHPSRAAERQGGGSYAPAWSTKPRVIHQYSSVTLDGKPLGNRKDVPPEHVFTRRFVEKRSHGRSGYGINLQFRGQLGLFVPLTNNRPCGGEDHTTVAVDLACKEARTGDRIKHDRTIGTDRQKLSNQHRIILEYRRRTGLKGVGIDHFMGTLASAEKAGLIRYQKGGAGKRAGEALAGYYPTEHWVPLDGVYQLNGDMAAWIN